MPGHIPGAPWTPVVRGHTPAPAGLYMLTDDTCSPVAHSALGPLRQVKHLRLSLPASLPTANLLCLKHPPPWRYFHYGAAHPESHAFSLALPSPSSTPIPDAPPAAAQPAPAQAAHTGSALLRRVSGSKLGPASRLGTTCFFL